MDDLEEFESWHEDLTALERLQDELERIKGENTYDDLHDFEDKRLFLQQETSTQSDAERCNNSVEQ
ncbi:MAG: hypothetical protein IAB93_06345 [Bacteroidetes bacterium]|uniref:Uncharacterized protein n=1 Tax=Candidatus Merdivivens pullistercoris TaxID=2840873 RepID=A0A9D9I4P5_9BACT|nr:hypothetical protein [Candidatus Merdivivens pullistercoris]